MRFDLYSLLIRQKLLNLRTALASWRSFAKLNSVKNSMAVRINSVQLFGRTLVAPERTVFCAHYAFAKNDVFVLIEALRREGLVFVGIGRWRIVHCLFN